MKRIAVWISGLGLALSAATASAINVQQGIYVGKDANLILFNKCRVEVWKQAKGDLTAVQIHSGNLIYNIWMRPQIVRVQSESPLVVTTGTALTHQNVAGDYIFDNLISNDQAPEATTLTLESNEDGLLTGAKLQGRKTLNCGQFSKTY